MTSLTLTADQIEYVAANVGDSVRVTLPFEDQLPKGHSWEVDKIDTVYVYWKDGEVSESFTASKLPFQIGATVEVSRVCFECDGSRYHGSIICDECMGKGTLATPYTLHFDKDPWCGTYFEYTFKKCQQEPDKFKGICPNTPDVIDLRKFIASYEATVRKVEVEG